MRNFSKPWTDAELYAKCKRAKEEIQVHRVDDQADGVRGKKKKVERVGVGVGRK